MSKKKKVKVNKRKFFSRIILLIIVIFILFSFVNNIFTDEEDTEISLIVNNEDITETLIDGAYIDKDETLYLSLEDIKNIFDEGIYYEESTNKIITTYGTKVGAIDVDNNTIEINSGTKIFSSSIISYSDKYYIPISELSSIYNIEVIVSNNIAMIFSLYEEQITVRISKNTSLKENTSRF